jgi:hypothetical protein
MWMQALLWVVAGMILGGIVVHRLTVLGWRSFKIVQVGVCDDPKCTMFHVGCVIEPRNATKSNRVEHAPNAKVLGFDDKRVTGVLGIRQNFLVPTTEDIGNDCSDLMGFYAHIYERRDTPMELFTACEGALAFILAKTDEKLVQGFLDLGTEEGVTVTMLDGTLRIAHPTADEAQLRQSLKYIAFKMTVEDLIEHRKHHEAEEASTKADEQPEVAPSPP